MKSPIQAPEEPERGAVTAPPPQARTPLVRHFLGPDPAALSEAARRDFGLSLHKWLWLEG